MQYKFIDNITDKKVFINNQSLNINPILAENSVNQFWAMKEFFCDESFLLCVAGYLGVGKSALVRHSHCTQAIHS